MKKIIVLILTLLLIAGAFFIGRQVGLNTEDSKTKTITREETVSEHDIKKTLTTSGQVESNKTEKIELSTSKYFKTMCVEDDDTVKNGDKIVEYSNGTYLKAPYDCVIISHKVPDSGDKCTSSNYIEISSLDKLQATISISENEISNIKLKQKVEIVLEADESKTYTGKITKIDSVGTYATSGTTFSAVVEFKNDGNIKLGMSLSCTIILEEQKNVASIPIDAISENSEGQEYVVKINEDGTTEEIIIESGIADDNYVQIKSGLNLNDKVQITTEITESTTNNSNSKKMTDNFGGERPDNMNKGDFRNMDNNNPPPQSKQN